jgi:hypothetical protein
LKPNETKNWSKFQKAFSLLTDLIKEIDEKLSTKLGLMLTTAYEQKNVKMAERNTKRLIFCSSKALLKEALENTELDKKALTKQAFIELQLLKNMDEQFSELSLSDEFSDALDNLENESKFNEIIESILKQLEIIID